MRWQAWQCQLFHWFYLSYTSKSKCYFFTVPPDTGENPGIKLLALERGDKTFPSFSELTNLIEGEYSSLLDTYYGTLKLANRPGTTHTFLSGFSAI